MHKPRARETVGRPPRRQPREDEETLSVRLTRKFADMIDGVNLSDAHVGDRLDLSQHDAEVLIAEGWAERAPRRAHTHKPTHALAADRPTGSRSPRALSRGDKPRRNPSTSLGVALSTSKGKKTARR